MTREILIDETPFGIRALLNREGLPARMMHHFHGRSPAPVGSLFWGKMGKRDDRLGGQVCDLGDAGPGLLPIRDRTYPEGSLQLVGVRREAVDGKKPILTDRPALRLPAATVAPSGDVKPGAFGVLAPGNELLEFARDVPSQPGALTPVPHAVRHIALIANSAVDVIVCNTGDVAAKIRPYLPESIRVDVDGRISLELDEAEERSLRRRVPVSGGGSLVFDEAEALTAIDLDVGQGQGKSAKGAAINMFREALDVLASEISLRALGGQLVLDLPRGAVRAPKMIRDQLGSLLKAAGLSSIPAVTKEGLVVMIFGQNRASLRDVLSDFVDDEGLVTPGRKWRSDVLANQAYSKVAHALREDLTRQVTLVLRDDVHSVWETRDASTPLNDVFGPRLSLKAGGEKAFRVETTS